MVDPAVLVVQVIPSPGQQSVSSSTVAEWSNGPTEAQHVRGFVTQWEERSEKRYQIFCPSVKIFGQPRNCADMDLVVRW